MPYLYSPATNPYHESTVPALLDSVRLQIKAIEAKGNKPAVVKMHASTSDAINEFMKPQLVKDPYCKGRHELYGLQVVVDPCMKPGTARVFMEWE